MSPPPHLPRAAINRLDDGIRRRVGDGSVHSPSGDLYGRATAHQVSARVQAKDERGDSQIHGARPFLPSLPLLSVLPLAEPTVRAQ